MGFISAKTVPHVIYPDIRLLHRKIIILVFSCQSLMHASLSKKLVGERWTRVVCFLPEGVGCRMLKGS